MKIDMKIIDHLRFVFFAVLLFVSRVSASMELSPLFNEMHQEIVAFKRAFHAEKYNCCTRDLQMRAHIINTANERSDGNAIIIERLKNSLKVAIKDFYSDCSSYQKSTKEVCRIEQIESKFINCSTIIAGMQRRGCFACDLYGEGNVRDLNDFLSLMRDHLDSVFIKDSLAANKSLQTMVDLFYEGVRCIRYSKGSLGGILKKFSMKLQAFSPICDKRFHAIERHMKQTFDDLCGDTDREEDDSE